MLLLDKRWLQAAALGAGCVWANGSSKSDIAQAALRPLMRFRRVNHPGIRTTAPASERARFAHAAALVAADDGG